MNWEYKIVEFDVGGLLDGGSTDADADTDVDGDTDTATDGAVDVAGDAETEADPGQGASERLNELGADGWELAAAVTRTQTGFGGGEVVDADVLVFKRPRRE
jgi:hypothetical protein